MHNKLNLPNALTLLRIILTPVMVLLTELALYPWALGVFCLAALTDALDGRLARKNNQITNLGKFLDPVADKALNTCAFVCLAVKGIVPAWFVCLVVFRDLAVDGLRLAAAGKGHISAAGIGGKIKTVLQMALVIAGYLALITALPRALITVLIAAAAVMTVVSGVKYLMQMKDALKD